jgi:DNA-binding NtrC family response regulator
MDSPAGHRLTWMAGIDQGGSLPRELAERLGTLELGVPPLRERREDLLALARLMLERAARREGCPVPWLERAAEKQLLEYPWPGNVRELEMLLGRTLLFTRGLAIRSFPDLSLGEAAPLCLPWPQHGELEAMQKAVARSAEAQLLQRSLAEAQGDLPRAAGALGLTLRTLAQRLRDHGIPLEHGEVSAAPNASPGEVPTPRKAP